MSTWLSSSRLARVLAPLVSLVPVASLAACGGDPDPVIIDPPPPVVDESALRASLDAWKPQLRKGCSLDDAFGAAPSWSAHSAPQDRQIDLDATQVVARMGGRLWVRDTAGELVVLTPPTFRRHTGFDNRNLPVRGADGSQRNITLATTLDGDNTCVVTMDGTEVFRGTLWEELPVQAHVAAAQPGKDVAATDDTYKVFAGPGAAATSTYVELDALDVVPDAFYADLDRAAALLAAPLGLSVADTAFYVVSRPAFLTHVEADAASAPFPLLEVSASGKPVDWYTSPTVPVDAAHLADWLPAQGAVTRTLQVHLARPSLPIAGLKESADRPLELTVHLSIEALADDKYRVRVVDVGAPREITGGAAAASGCIEQTAKAALGYVAHPALQPSGVPRYPFALQLGFGPSVSASWITAPCRVLTGDLAAAVRGDRAALVDVVALLDRAGYAGPQADRGVEPRGWDTVLAGFAADDAGVGALEAVQGNNALMTAAIHAQRVLLRDARYTKADDDERLARRTLVWRNGLLCGADLVDNDVGVLLDVPADKLADTIADTTACPWPH
jgi:hypothetical protein